MKNLTIEQITFLIDIKIDYTKAVRDIAHDDAMKKELNAVIDALYQMRKVFVYILDPEAKDYV